jgi:hypothetical protein
VEVDKHESAGVETRVHQRAGSRRRIDMNPIGKPPAQTSAIENVKTPAEQLMNVILARVTLQPSDLIALVMTVAAIPPQLAHRSHLALLNAAQDALIQAGYQIHMSERTILKQLLQAALAAPAGRAPNAST